MFLEYILFDYYFPYTEVLTQWNVSRDIHQSTKKDSKER